MRRSTPTVRSRRWKRGKPSWTKSWLRQTAWTRGQWTPPEPSTQAMPPWRSPVRVELNRMSDEAKFDWRLRFCPCRKPAPNGLLPWAISTGRSLPIQSIPTKPSRRSNILPRRMTRCFEKYGQLPARSDITLPATGNAKKDAALKVFQEQLQYRKARGPHPEWPKISKQSRTRSRRR